MNKDGENKGSTCLRFIQIRLAFSYKDSRDNTFQHTIIYFRLKQSLRTISYKHHQYSDLSALYIIYSKPFKLNVEKYFFVSTL